MNKSFLNTVITFSVVMALTLVVSGAPVLAQLHGHSDIEFGYMDGKIEVEWGGSTLTVPLNEVRPFNPSAFYAGAAGGAATRGPGTE